ncbi:MAG TPA: aldehyde dehydrogenase family protein [Candidatus Acidoferrales bacterium]|nr:aldehyde dehydrogenase family protein [Candidatus Acidoferrales bacterium]
MQIESTSPGTGQSIGCVESTSPSRISRIVEDARQIQKEWMQLPHGRRVQIIREFGRIFFTRKREIADLISRENGKPVVEAYASEIIPTLDMINYYSKKSRRILRHRNVKITLPLLRTKKAWVAKEPYGVVGIISPWNYPVLLPLGQIVPALLAGNTVVFKPSEFTPIVGERISELLQEAGVPENVFNIIQGGSEVGSSLVSSGVDKLFFTGSTPTGRRVSELAARDLTPVSLELGGKDAMIVLDDAHIESAASGAIWGAFMNAGQTCVSIERCFVHEKIYDQFVELTRQKTKELRLGSGIETDLGAMIHRAQFDVVKRHVEDAVQRGARIVAGGIFSDNPAHFIQPTILTDVPVNSTIMNEETFGPVLPILKFGSDEEAVSLANGSRFGLSVSVWTGSRKRGLAIAKKLHAGAAIVNDAISYYGMSDGIVGGVKQSGNGRVHGREGLLEMVYTKYYEIERAPRLKKLWWYSYSTDMSSFFESATDFLFAANFLYKMNALLKLLPKYLRIKKI